METKKLYKFTIIEYLKVTPIRVYIRNSNVIYETSWDAHTGL